MPYRKPAPKSPKAPSDSSDLQNRDRNIDAQRSAEEENEREKTRKEESDKTRTHLHESMIQSSAEFQVFLVVCTLLGVVPGLAAMVFGLLRGERAFPMVAGLVVTVACVLLLFRSRRWFGARAVARERDFIYGLAFGVSGYEEVLSRAPSAGTLTLHITFAGSPPSRADMVDLAGLLQAEVEAVGENQFKLKSPRLSVDQGDGPDSNHAFHQWRLQGACRAAFPRTPTQVRQSESRPWFLAIF
jgi:hypothetical protein